MRGCRENPSAGRARSAGPLFAALFALACVSLSLAGCGSQGTVGRSVEIPQSAWAEMGAAEGAAAGEREGWAWWNRLISKYDAAFARLILRHSPEIDPARAHFSEWAVLESNEREAIVEEGIWLVDQPRLAPYGAKGFAGSLSVHSPPAAPAGDRTWRPSAFQKAYAQAWAASYAAALHEREIALEEWIKDRYAIYRADVLIANGQVVAPKVSRTADKAHPQQPYRRAEKREVWVLSGGTFSSGSRPE